MIELLQAQLQLARAMVSLSKDIGERSAWLQYHETIKRQLEELQRPPRVRPPPVITRP